MKSSIRVQLSSMMFLEYFIWGAWYVTMGTYLGKTLQFSGLQIGLAYGTAAIAAMISPFIVGLIADRFFATQKVLGVLHLAGAVLMYFASEATSFGTFYPLVLAYTLCYMPTIALTNSLSFHQMDKPEKEFPLIRVLGTAGWIAVGWIIGPLGLEATALPMQIAAGSSVLLGIYSFFLPDTPPKQKGKKLTVSEILGLDALSLLQNRSFLVLFVASVLICIPLSFYYAWANPFLNEIGIQNAAGKMTFGQMSEAGFLLLMPFFFRRLGVKWMMVIGMMAWVTRYILFAFGSPDEMVWMLYAGIILHGICYDFFFVTGQIYADNEAPSHLKSSVQGLMTFATYGVGMFIGTWISGKVVDMYVTGKLDGAELHDWNAIWLIPAAFSAVVMLGFFAFFREKKKE